VAVAVNPDTALRDVRVELHAVLDILREAGLRDGLPGLQRMVQYAAEPADDPQVLLTRLATLYVSILAVPDGFQSAYVPDQPGGWGVDRDRSDDLDRRRQRLRELLRPYEEQR